MNRNGTPRQPEAPDELVKQLLAARADPDALVRLELRDEVRIMALVVVAHELSILNTSMSQVLSTLESVIHGIDVSIEAHNNLTLFDKT
jgi:hypothetical protein